MPAVRVVIPTYNRARLLEQALLSVAAQTFRDFEVVVADDGSTDETAAVLDRWERRDNRVHSIRLDRRGVAAARNRALAHPGAYRYVAFLDSDDEWLPDHVERSVDLLDSWPQGAVTFAAFETIDHTGTWTTDMLRGRDERVHKPLMLAVNNPRPDAFALDPDGVLKSLLRAEFSPHPSTTLVRASSIGPPPWFDEGFEILEDCLWFVRVADAGQRFAYFDTVHSRVQYHGDNLTGGHVDLRSPATLRRQLAVLQYLNTIRHYARTGDDIRMLRGRIADQQYVIGQCYAEQCDTTKARHFYFDSLRRPSRRALKGVIAIMLPDRLRAAIRRWRPSD
jgi:glycosyltransferase involved in cell wall biosynthesis